MTPVCADSMSPKAKTFRAILEQAGTGPYWVIARIPFDPKKVWPEWTNRRVRGTVNGFAFQTSIFPNKTLGLMFVVNKKMQAGAAAGPGSTVKISLEPDLEGGSYQEPKELTAVLRQEKDLRRAFDALSPSMRKGLAHHYIDQAKGKDTRKQRAERVAETLMQALEGEQFPPPILRAAFQRHPLAEKGWRAMTPTQRRNHLLGIFLTRTMPARERRAAYAIEKCVQVARRKSGAAPIPDEPFEFD
jgi:uncharacterized protein YdeI (YjbR/CyaY-like superfamily)